MGPMGRRARRRGLIVGAAVGSAAAHRSQPDDSAVPAGGEVDQMAELEKLASLKDKGIITQEEFNAKKKQILGL